MAEGSGKWVLESCNIQTHGRCTRCKLRHVPRHSERGFAWRRSDRVCVEVQELAMNPVPIALHQAARRADVAEIKRLVASGVDVDSMDSMGHTAMHTASVWGHLDVLKTLVALKGNIHAKNTEGFTPLAYAARGGHAEAVKTMVVELRANVHALNFEHATPLHSAAAKGHAETVKTLLQVRTVFSARRVCCLWFRKKIK